MALKLTRRPGESIVIKHNANQNCQPKIRFTLRKAGVDDGGRFVELQYFGNVDFLIESCEGQQLPCKADQIFAVKHYVDGSQIMIIVSKDNMISFDCKIGFSYNSRNQIGIWFEANREVDICRDELEDTPLCLS